MVFKIIDMDKMHRQFKVQDESGKQLVVKGIQIISVLLQDNKCINAYLIEDGFRVYKSETEFVDIRPALNSTLRKGLAKYIKTEKQKQAEVLKQQQLELEAEKRRQAEAEAARQRQLALEKQRQQQLALEKQRQVEKPVEKSTDKIKTLPYNKLNNGVEKHISIYYRGTLYKGYRDICRRNGCKDVDTFEKMYQAGYPIPVCLGKEIWDSSKPNPKPRFKQEEALLGISTESKWYSSAIG